MALQGQNYFLSKLKKKKYLPENIVSVKFRKKTVLHAINSHVLTSTNPCINKAIHVLVMHGFAVLRISISRPS